jgi:acetyl-CoA acetyltransferase
MGIQAVYVVDAVRTPIGKYAGALSMVRPDDLAATVIKALIERNPNVPVTEIEEVILGAANQAGEDNRNVARMAALLAGLPVTVSGNTVNRLCASGLQAIVDASRGIMLGDGEIYIAGGSENMSRAPFVMNKAQSATEQYVPYFNLTIPMLNNILAIRSRDINITTNHTQNEYDYINFEKLLELDVEKHSSKTPKDATKIVGVLLNIKE